MLLAIGCGPKRPPEAPQSAVDRRIAAAQGHEKNRRYDLAEAEYRAAVAEAGSQKQRGKARRALASALIFWGKYAEAEVALANLVVDRPDEPGAWHDLGMVRAKLGKATGAEQALRQSVRLAPRDPRPRIALAALLVNGRRYRAAQIEYRALLDLELPAKLRSAVNQALDLLDRQLELDRGATGR
ncbi:MAG: hypothetical protein KJO07_17070 [Deltaproteobacteria bacterium]|jgi:Flp pilus assembly protein TadD|nr:hypothetical protein [Deltaproteobacteria bacterium]